MDRGTCKAIVHVVEKVSDMTEKPAYYWDFPDGSDGKESACKAGDPASIPGLGWEDALE